MSYSIKKRFDRNKLWWIVLSNNFSKRKTIYMKNVWTTQIRNFWLKSKFTAWKLKGKCKLRRTYSDKVVNKWWQNENKRNLKDSNDSNLSKTRLRSLNKDVWRRKRKFKSEKSFVKRNIKNAWRIKFDLRNLKMRQVSRRDKFYKKSCSSSMTWKRKKF